MSTNVEKIDIKLVDENKRLSSEEVFFDLKRRLKTTRHARINASKRLRKKHEFYEKVTHFYSVLILVLSIWFISDTNASASNLVITKILLILSLSLTFFTMYINIRNYKERASEFESNYRNLDIILNKMDRIETLDSEITTEKLKDLHREYEKLILDKENHQNIDYMTSNKKLKAKFKNDIFWYKVKDFVITSLVAIFPIILFITIYFANRMFGLFLTK